MGTILLFIFMGMTLLSLVVGVVGMASGSDFNAKYGNHLMIARVASQVMAVATLLFFFAAK